MGMTPIQIFFQIELPLAFPIIMAGVRNAGIALVGIAAVASIIGAGALGDFILLGVNTTSIDLILLGAIPAVILAVLLDTLLQLLESLFTSPGIRRQQQ
jgi:osmoprotectant transport system permease protein